jgi:hypothetical protein
MEDGLPIAARCDQSGVHEAVQVVVERRPRDIEPFLQLRRGEPLGARLNDSAQNGKTRNVSECGELLGVAFDGPHIHISRSVDE